MLTQKIVEMARLFRPELSLSAGICVTTGQILASGRLPQAKIGILGFLCAFCLSSTALIINDYFDVEVDQINAPNRPLPSGVVTRTEVMVLAIVTLLVGLSAAFALGLDALIVSIIFGLIGFLYNWRFKQTGILGNLMVSSSVAVTFILGGITVHAPWSAIVWIFSGMAFFIDLGEEIAGDAMDIEGDKKRGSHSIAIEKGKRFALTVSVALWGLVILLGFIPVVLGLLGINYLIMIMAVDVLIVFFSIRLFKAKTPENGRQAMRGIYLGAILCVIAFLIGLFVG
jgi:geranylgeranylglycerol-phosphate geranylgeranyltransferase